MGMSATACKATRISGLVVVLGLAATACGAPLAETTATAAAPTEPAVVEDAVEADPAALTSDGALDCDDGLLPVSVDISVSGDSEQDVVAAALEQWTAQGAVVVAAPPTENWAAVLDGRDVALALPELNGDGTWVVQGVAICGEPRVGAAPIDGELDCANDAGWGYHGDFGPDASSPLTSEEALSAEMEPILARFGGEVVYLTPSSASLVVEQREQIIVTAVELPAGGWAASQFSGCEGYEVLGS